MLLPDPNLHAIAYQRSQDFFWCADQALGLAIPLLVLFSGLGRRLLEVCRRIGGGRWFVTIALFAMAFATVDFGIRLPLAFWEGYANEQRFGLAAGSPIEWMKEQFVGYGISLTMVFLVAWIPYFFLRHTPRSWWLWSTAAFAPLFVCMYIVAPVWIAPITDNFEPLANKELALRISSLAARAGIPNALVLVKDQSHTSRIPNAQVRGMLGTERIVLFDTMSDPASERELLVLVGHEMGHYVAGDMWKFVALQLSFVLLGLWLTDRLAPAAVRRFGPRWGFTTLCSPGSLPFLYLTFNLVVLATTPVVNNLVRNAERDADRFALDLTHDGEAAQSLAIKYMQIALDVPKPGPFRRIFRMDHPSFDERVRFAIHYHPWTQNSDIAR